MFDLALIKAQIKAAHNEFYAEASQLEASVNAKVSSIVNEFADPYKQERTKLVNDLNDLYDSCVEIAKQDPIDPQLAKLIYLDLKINATVNGHTNEELMAARAQDREQVVALLKQPLFGGFRQDETLRLMAKAVSMVTGEDHHGKAERYVQLNEIIRQINVATSGLDESLYLVATTDPAYTATAAMDSLSANSIARVGTASNPQEKTVVDSLGRPIGKSDDTKAIEAAEDKAQSDAVNRLI